MQRWRQGAGVRDQGGSPGGTENQAREDSRRMPDAMQWLAGREPPDHGGQRAGQVCGRQAGRPEAEDRAALDAEGGSVKGEQQGEPDAGWMAAQGPPGHGIPGQQGELERQRPGHRGRPRPVAVLRLPGNPGTRRHSRDIAHDRGHDQSGRGLVAGADSHTDQHHVASHHRRECAAERQEARSVGGAAQYGQQHHQPVTGSGVQVARRWRGSIERRGQAAVLNCRHPDDPASRKLAKAAVIMYEKSGE